MENKALGRERHTRIITIWLFVFISGWKLKKEGIKTIPEVVYNCV